MNGSSIIFTSLMLIQGVVPYSLLCNEDLMKCQTFTKISDLFCQKKLGIETEEPTRSIFPDLESKKKFREVLENSVGAELVQLPLITTIKIEEYPGIQEMFLEENSHNYEGDYVKRVFLLFLISFVTGIFLCLVNF